MNAKPLTFIQFQWLKQLFTPVCPCFYTVHLFSGWVEVKVECIGWVFSNVQICFCKKKKNNKKKKGKKTKKSVQKKNRFSNFYLFIFLYIYLFIFFSCKFCFSVSIFFLHKFKHLKNSTDTQTPPIVFTLFDPWLRWYELFQRKSNINNITRKL